MPFHEKKKDTELFRFFISSCIIVLLSYVFFKDSFLPFHISCSVYLGKVLIILFYYVFHMWGIFNDVLSYDKENLFFLMNPLGDLSIFCNFLESYNWLY